jgi:hypothetical protein
LSVGLSIYYFRDYVIGRSVCDKFWTIILVTVIFFKEMSKGFGGVGRGDYFFLIVVQDIRNGFEFVSFDRVYFVPYYFR